MSETIAQFRGDIFFLRVVVMTGLVSIRSTRSEETIWRIRCLPALLLIEGTVESSTERGMTRTRAHPLLLIHLFDTDKTLNLVRFQLRGKQMILIQSTSKTMKRTQSQRRKRSNDGVQSFGMTYSFNPSTTQHQLNLA